MKEIETTAENTVKEINNNITENERIEIYKNLWSRKEKYIQKKIMKVNKERTRIFSEIIFSRCQYKQEFDPKKRSVIKNNVLKNNVFTPLKLENMKNNVTEEIQINNPIELININIPPEKDERMQYNLPEFLQDSSNEESFEGFENEPIPNTQEIDIFIQKIRNHPIQTTNSPSSSDPRTSTSESSYTTIQSNQENNQLLNREDEQLMIKKRQK